MDDDRTITIDEFVAYLVERGGVESTGAYGYIDHTHASDDGSHSEIADGAGPQRRRRRGSAGSVLSIKDRERASDTEEEEDGDGAGAVMMARRGANALLCWRTAYCTAVYGCTTV